MKYCPQCQKQYTETWITFCSDDGTILIDTDYSQDPQARNIGGQRPPYAPPRSEQPTWRSPDPNAPGAWPPEQPVPTPSPAWQPPPPPRAYTRPQQNGLATASLILGVIGLLVGFCFGPLPGIAALILGIIALNQINKSPQTTTGKPLAIVGIVTGSLSVLVYGVIFIGWILGGILSSR